MTLKELEAQLLSLSQAERAEAMQLLGQSLDSGWRGITRTPGVCGGDACIAGTRIPIWVLVQARRLGVSESQLLEDYPSLTASDLTSAWVYADTHSDEIATALQDNEEA
ncbi:MAG: DUF433 domain-containing protein [Oculatellaceae cyanobacterium Prado106]|jgi:uncharacterized protein (DUF433 family)|nr:DUF433 domain-containing protein [Oculatellaceae cyanobacterium Prado106]